MANDTDLDHNNRLQPLHMRGVNYNIKDNAKFDHALKLLKESLFDGGASMYCADNVITWYKNLSFLREDRFVARLKDPTRDSIEKSTVWRLYILLYFAKLALDLDGDFLECGVYKGTTASDILAECDLEKHEKRYWLYDLFEWKDGDGHTQLAEHRNANMYEEVVARFINHRNVNIIKGSVPESFSEGFPEKISFCHIDMNHPAPEAGALQRVLPNLVKGGFIIFDDYGWWYYSAQKRAIDKILKSFSQEILELPTGQGLLIKR